MDTFRLFFLTSQVLALEFKVKAIGLTVSPEERSTSRNTNLRIYEDDPVGESYLAIIRKTRDSRCGGNASDIRQARRPRSVDEIPPR